MTAHRLDLTGYIIDLLDALANNTEIGVEFRPVTPVADGQYGKRVGGVWNGMIKELIDKVCEPLLNFTVVFLMSTFTKLVNDRPNRQS